MIRSTESIQPGNVNATVMFAHDYPNQAQMMFCKPQLILSYRTKIWLTFSLLDSTKHNELHWPFAYASNCYVLSLRITRWTTVAHPFKLVLIERAELSALSMQARRRNVLV